MPRRLTFEQALETYLALRGSEDPDALDLFEAAEIGILKHLPRSPIEAAAIVEVVMDNLENGGRGDGLDIRAMKHLRAWLDPRPSVPLRKAA
ncbi:MAG: hypothetical protein ACK4Z5_07185 [Brevundimonas sp.]